MLRNLLGLYLFAQALGHTQAPLNGPETNHSPTWLEKYGAQIDQPFSGPLSFSHLPYHRCLEEENSKFDIALLGLPFDTGVSYRPGYLHYPSRPTMARLNLI